MVDFRQYGDFLLALCFVLLAEMYLFYGRKDAVVDVERLVNAATPTTTDHLTHLPLLNPLVLAHQIVLNNTILALLQQKRDTLHNRVTLLTVLTAL